MQGEAAMGKPQWLIDKENGIEVKERECNMCIDCAYRGKPFKFTYHKGKEKTAVYECDIHVGCLNTKFSICCDDFTPKELV